MGNIDSKRINVRYALTARAHLNLVRYQRKLRMTIDPEITREQAINHLLSKLKV